MWQRARIKASDTREMVGCLVWVEMGRPEEVLGVGMAGRRITKRAYKTNLTAPPHRDVRLSAEKVELLGEFADVVPAIDLREFILGLALEEK